MSNSNPEDKNKRVHTEAGLELLARAVEFLSICRSDPEQALETDDPTLLVEGLRSLLSDLGGKRGLSRVEDSSEQDEQDPPLAA
jgi:hypothetical protein